MTSFHQAIAVACDVYDAHAETSAIMGVPPLAQQDQTLEQRIAGINRTTAFLIGVSDVDGCALVALHALSMLEAALNAAEVDVASGDELRGAA